MTRHCYNEDVLAWTEEQAALLRAGQVSALDLNNLAEEIERLGVSQKQELRARLALLLRHLLRYHYQSEYRSPSWRTPIAVHRMVLDGLLEDSPSLRSQIEAVLPNAYGRARLLTLEETGLLRLPEQCPFSVTEILALDWWPA